MIRLNPINTLYKKPIFTSYLIRASFRAGGLYSYSGQPHALSLMPWVTVLSLEGEVWWDREASPWAWIPGSHTVLSAAVAPGRFLAARSLTPDLPILACLPFPDWTSWPCLPAHVWREPGPWGVGGLCFPRSLAEPWTQTNWVPGVLCSWGRKKGICPCSRMMMSQDIQADDTVGPSFIPHAGTEHFWCDSCHPMGSCVCPVLGTLTSWPWSGSYIIILLFILQSMLLALT